MKRAMIIFLILTVLTAAIPLVSLIKDDKSKSNGGALAVFSSTQSI
jgi:hypothetical protein